jgi:hypothetical protein
MAIKKYFASKDSSITNAYKSNLTTRATGSNMGRADILEVFSIYGQAESGSTELMRSLLEFPVASIVADRSIGRIPASGNVNFYLNVYNAAHGLTLPRNYTLEVLPVSRTWEEGNGLDMEDYSDSTYNSIGVNWVNASSGTAWTKVGGDFDTNSIFTQSFDQGYEHLKLDISSLVEQWISGAKNNYGIAIKLTSSNEAYYSSSTGADSSSIPHNPNGAQTSYYTKKFFSRSSEYFFFRPTLEARWDSTVKDDRNNFYLSSANVPAQDNLNTIYLYNYSRGRLVNIPSVGTGSIYVKIYDDASGSTQITTTPNNPVTGGWVSTGVYSASFALATTASQVFDRWFDSTLTTCFHTGAIDTIEYDSSDYAQNTKYINKIINLKQSYGTNEIARFNIFTRPKDWNPNIYTVATSEIVPTIIPSGSYKLYRLVDNLEIIPFSTGSNEYFSHLSYDVNGNYFDLDMSILEPGYSYGIKLCYYNGAISMWIEQNELFKFRVDAEHI